MKNSLRSIRKMIIKLNNDFKWKLFYASMNKVFLNYIMMVHDIGIKVII